MDRTCPTSTTEVHAHDITLVSPRGVPRTQRLSRVVVLSVRPVAAAPYGSGPPLPLEPMSVPRIAYGYTVSLGAALLSLVVAVVVSTAREPIVARRLSPLRRTDTVHLVEYATARRGDVSSSAKGPVRVRARGDRGAQPRPRRLRASEILETGLGAR